MKAGASRVAKALRMAAQGLHHANNEMGEYYRRMRAKLGGAAGVASMLLDFRTSAVMLHLLNLAAASDSVRACHNAHFSLRAMRQVESAERYIQQNHDEITSLAEVARHVGLSHDHLRHVFRQVRGQSLVRYLNEIRIARARTLLAHTMQPIKEVADLCGFCDEYYFSAMFRRFCGVAPGAYREQHRTQTPSVR